MQSTGPTTSAASDPGYDPDHDECKMQFSQSQMPSSYILFLISVEYWILSTDYTSYAVTYSCHHTYEDGTCDKQREALWVLSRTPTLPHTVEKKVDEAIRGACLDPVQVIDNQGTCRVKTM